MWRFVTVFFCIHVATCVVFYQPEQIHLSYGDTLNTIVVTWSTLNKTGKSVVEYGIGGLILEAKGNSTIFQSAGSLKRIQYIHRVKLSKLTWDSIYVYHCGNPDYGWSELFKFRVPPNPNVTPQWMPTLAIFGDMGNENAVSLPFLQEEVQRGMYDAIIHAGDFAYDMDSENGKVGDEFMNQIQPIAAYVPYMTCPGNHEEANNFSDYRARFSMPGGTEGLFYSFNMGPVHFVSISTEVYYFLQYGLKMLANQFEWLLNDLEEANRPENRAVRPWIVVYGHRPMYCSNNNNDDCTSYGTLTRIGLPVVKWFGLEEVFCKYGVDLLIWAHEHSYERLWPIYNYKVYNGSYAAPYRNPRAPVHITTGSAGCKELHDEFKEVAPPWSAFRSTDFGYMRMKVVNSSHLYMEQISIDLEGAVIDHLWLVRDEHKPFECSG